MTEITSIISFSFQPDRDKTDGDNNFILQNYKMYYYKENDSVAHEYSIKIHDYLTGKIADAQKNKKKAKSLEDFGNVQFYNGQLEELFSVRKYLTDQIDLDTHKYYN